MLERFRLGGKVAVVTGSGRGIGRAIALGLAEAGADVVVTARRGHEIDAVAEEIRAHGGRALAVVGDIRTEEVNERLAATAVEPFGSLDIWVSNAGGSDERRLRPIERTPLASWDEQLLLNLTAPFLGARAAAAHLTEGGAIVHIASVAALRPSWCIWPRRRHPGSPGRCSASPEPALMAVHQAQPRVVRGLVGPSNEALELFDRRFA